MSEITITNKEKISGGWRFKLETSAETEHVVTLSEDYYQQLTDGDITPKKLIEESFKFLLDNEPASAILSAFELKEIENYFPEFPKTAKGFTQPSN